MRWVEVCALEDILPDTGVCALIDGRQVAVFRLAGSDEVFAIDNYDPNSGANVLSRGIVGDLGGQLVVASPVYKQHFNLATGVCLEDPTASVRAYPACVVDGHVRVGIGD
ncbi:MAG TPA: nitrite reductase small subunit NirD [Nevskiales bacterium]|nr:nitrite reductase small subunit NirD [Nevskiales bacterium]